MRFRLLSIPVRVDVTFLIIALLGNFRDLSLIAAWTVAAFVAVLAHEMGHALTVRAFGIRQVAVTLFALGGVTTYPAEPRLSPGRQFLVSASGSLVGIALGGAAFVAGRAGVFDGADDIVVVFMSSLVWIGAVLGLANWLPIRPLDGGQMLTSALELVTTPQRADTIATITSLVAGATAAALAFVYLTAFAGFFVVLITVMGLRSSGAWRRMRASQRRPSAPASAPPAASPDEDPDSFPI
jgi:Zn-dependent protease